MARAIGGLVIQLITALLVFAVNMGFALIANFIRTLPWLVPMVARLFWRWIQLTCHLYVFLLTLLHPLIRRHLRFNLLAPTPRRIATISLSMVSGIVLLLFFQSPLTTWGWLARIPFGVW